MQVPVCSKMSDSWEEWLDSQLALTSPTPTLVEGPQEAPSASVQHDDTAIAADVTVASGFIDLSCFDDKTYMAPPTETATEIATETATETSMETAMPTDPIVSHICGEPIKYQENMYIIDGQVYVPLKDVLDTIIECQQHLKKHISWLGNQDKRMTWIRRDVTAAGEKLHRVYAMLRQNFYPKKVPHPANRK